MNRRSLSLLVAVGLGLCGCLARPAPPADVSSKRLYDDIPVMPGLKSTRNPFIFDIKGGRLCQLKYAGNVEPLEAVGYYKNQMVANKWQYESAIGSDPIILRFSKGNERATVVVQNKGENLTEVSITVGDEDVPMVSHEANNK